MATKIRPLHDRVIVKRIGEEEKTKGGIIIPDTAKEKPQEGKVVAVGPGKHEDGKVIPLGATRFFLANILALKSNWTVRNISSCEKMISSESLNKEVKRHGRERDSI